jgi:hypothetical protein
VKWWLRARRIRAIAASVSALAAVVLVAPSLAIPMPALFAAYGLSVPVVLLAPLAVSTALGWGLGADVPPLELGSTRQIGLFDRAYVVAVLACGSVLVLLVATAVGAPGALGAIRSLVAFTGLLLVGRQLLGGRAGSAVPAAVVLAMAVFGGDADGQPRPWAFPLAPEDSISSWLLSAGLLTLGVALLGRGTRARCAN